VVLSGYRGKAVPRLRCLIKKKIGINKSAVITKKDVIQINQLNYKAPENSHATENSVGYSLHV
jgi:hypothetical protein